MFKTLRSPSSPGVGHAYATQSTLFEGDIARGTSELESATKGLQRGRGIVQIEERGSHPDRPVAGSRPIAATVLERHQITLVTGSGCNTAPRMLDLDQGREALGLHRQVANLATDRQAVLELRDRLGDLSVPAQRLRQADHDAALQAKINRTASRF